MLYLLIISLIHIEEKEKEAAEKERDRETETGREGGRVEMKRKIFKNVQLVKESSINEFKVTNKSCSKALAFIQCW